VSDKDASMPLYSSSEADPRIAIRVSKVRHIKTTGKTNNCQERALDSETKKTKQHEARLTTGGSSDDEDNNFLICVPSLSSGWIMFKMNVSVETLLISHGNL
jgi:hypothetical protein